MVTHSTECHINLNNQRLDDLVFRMKKLVGFQDLHAKTAKDREGIADHMLDKNSSALQESVYLERSNDFIFLADIQELRQRDVIIGRFIDSSPRFVWVLCYPSRCSILKLIQGLEHVHIFSRTRSNRHRTHAFA